MTPQFSVYQGHHYHVPELASQVTQFANRLSVLPNREMSLAKLILLWKNDKFGHKLFSLISRTIVFHCLSTGLSSCTVLRNGTCLLISEVCGNANISFNQHHSHSKDTPFFRLMTHVVQDLLNFSLLLDKINILFTGHLDKVFPTVFRCQELNRFQCYWQASHGFCLIWI